MMCCQDMPWYAKREIQVGRLLRVQSNVVCVEAAHEYCDEKSGSGAPLVRVGEVLLAAPDWRVTMDDGSWRYVEVKAPRWDRYELNWFQLGGYQKLHELQPEIPFSLFYAMNDGKIYSVALENVQHGDVQYWWDQMAYEWDYNRAWVYVKKDCLRHIGTLGAWICEGART